MGHVQGGVAIGDIVPAQVADQLRQVDHAVAAVDVAITIVRADIEQIVLQVQHAEGFGTVSRTDDLRFGQITVDLQVLDGPNGGIDNGSAGLHLNFRGNSGKDGARQCLAAQGNHPVPGLGIAGQVAGVIGPFPVPGDRMDRDPSFAVRVELLDFVMVAFCFVPGQGKVVGALVGAGQDQLRAQQVFPDDAEPVGDQTVVGVATPLAVGIQHKGMGFLKARHRIIPPVSKEEGQITAVQRADLGQGTVSVFVIQPGRGGFIHIEGDLDRIGIGVSDPIQVFDPGHRKASLNLQIAGADAGALVFLQGEHIVIVCTDPDDQFLVPGNEGEGKFLFLKPGGPKEPLLTGVAGGCGFQNLQQVTIVIETQASGPGKVDQTGILIFRIMYFEFSVRGHGRYGGTVSGHTAVGKPI